MADFNFDDYISRRDALLARNQERLSKKDQLLDASVSRRAELATAIGLNLPGLRETHIREREDLEVASDAAHQVIQGTGSALSNIAEASRSAPSLKPPGVLGLAVDAKDLFTRKIGQAIGGKDVFKEAADAMDNVGQQIHDFGKAGISEPRTREIEQRQQRIAKITEEKGEWAGLGAAFMENVKDPEGLYEQVANLGVTFLLGRAGGKYGAMAGGAMLHGGDVASGTREGLEKLPDELFQQQSEVFNRLVESGMDKEQARQVVIDEKARESFLSGASISGALNRFMPGGGAIESVLAGQATRALNLRQAAKKILGGAFGETVSEGGEEGSGQFITNERISQINPEQSLTENVGAATGQGAAMGLQMGGGISTLSATGNLVVGEAQQAAKKILEKDLKNKVFEAAKESGDISVFTDKESSLYDPSKAIAVLHSINQKEGTTEEQKTKNAEQVSSLLTELEDTYELQQRAYSRHSPEGMAQLERQIKADKLALEGVEPNSEQAKNLAEAITIREEILAEADPKKAKEEKKKLDTLQEQIISARKLREDMLASENEQASNPEELIQRAIQPDTDVQTNADRQDAAKQLLTLAMRSPGEFMEKASLELGQALQGIIKDTSNGLTQEQRGYLRQLSEARELQNRLKTTDTVQQEIYTGSEQNLGIRQYEQEIGDALSRGDRAKADKYLGWLRKFASDHKAKHTAAAEALKAMRSSGRNTQILKKRDGGWEVPERNIPYKVARKNGGYTFYANSQYDYNKVVGDMDTASQALQSTLSALESGYALNFESTQSTQAAPSAPSSQGQNQSNPKTTVDSVKSEPKKAQEAPVKVETETKPVVEKTAVKVESTQTTQKDAEPQTTDPEAPGYVPPWEEVGSVYEQLSKLKNGYPMRKPTAEEQVVLDALTQRITKGLGKLGETLLSNVAEIVVMDPGKPIENTGSVATIDGKIYVVLKASALSMDKHPGTGEPRDQFLNRVMVHELGHVSDIVSGSDWLLNNDTVLNEAKAFLEQTQDPFWQSFFNYPLSQTDATKLKRELFAQLFTMYHLYPGAISGQAALQETFKRFQENQGQGTRATESVRDTDGRDVSDGRPPWEEEAEGTEAGLEPVAELDWEADIAAAEASFNAEIGVVTEANEAPQQADGMLGVLAREPAAKEALLTQVAREGKLFATYFKQSLKRATDTTNRPLVAVKDFLKAASEKAVSVWDFFPAKESEIYEDDRNMVRLFGELAPKWNELIRKSLNRWVPSNPDFLYKDPMQELLIDGADGKLDLEENVKTAVSYAVMSWIIENSMRSTLNTDEDINRMIGRPSDYPVSDAEREAMRDVDIFENTLINNLGNRAFKALGLTAGANAPQDFAANAPAALGTHALFLLKSLDVLDEVTITGKQYMAMQGNTEDLSMLPSAARAQRMKELKQRNDEKHIYYALARKTELVKRISENSKGARDTLDRLFSVESAVSFPSFEPVEFNQERTVTGQAVSEKQKEILNNHNKQKNFIKQDNWNAFSELDEDIQLEIADGGIFDATTMQVMGKDSLEAKTDALRREIANMYEFIEMLNGRTENQINSPFHFNHVVWSQYRVGIDNNGINPQMIKVHRGLIYREGWESTVELDKNNEPTANFKLRVLEGLGIKTGNETNARSLLRMKGLFNPENTADLNTKEQAKLDALNAAVDVLVKRRNGEAISREEQEAIRDGVKAGGEAMHTFDTLIALANLRDAQNKKQKSFTTTVMGEIDGVSNGPVMAHLLFGAALDSKDLAEFLKKGGIYGKDEAGHYNHWRAQAKSLDIYETMTARAVEQLDKDKADSKIGFVYNAVQFFIGELIADGTVTSAGRNLSKDPIRPLIFGSGMGRAVESMAEAYLDGLAKKLEKLPSGETKEDRQARAQAITQLNTLLYGSQKLNPNMSKAEVLRINFSDEQKATIKDAFAKTFGVAYKKTVKSELEIFLNRKDTITRTSNLIFDLFHAVYQSEREAFIQELMAKGQMDVGKTGKPRHDLTKVQERAFHKRLEKLYPTIHTAYSKQEGDLSSALPLFAKDRVLSQNRLYRPEVHLSSEVSENTAKHPHSQENILNGPGVTAVSMPIHSADSFISHMANQLGLHINLHDAQGTGLDGFTEMGQNMNKALWDLSLNYSPLGELSASMDRTLQHLREVMKRKKLPPNMKESVARVLAEYALKEFPDGEAEGINILEALVQRLKNEAYRADTNKLDVMAQTYYYDQYASEGARYEVTDADREQAQQKRKEAEESKELSKDTETAVLAIHNHTEKRAAEIYNELWEAAEFQKAKKALYALSKVETLQLITGYLLGNVDAPATLQKQLKQAREELKKQNNLAETVDASGMEEAAWNSVLLAMKQQMAYVQQQSWSKTGKPAKKSDATLVEMFEQFGGLTGVEVLTYLKEKLAQDKTPFGGFSATLVDQLISMNPDIGIRYITKMTDPLLVLGNAKPAGNVPGWYVSEEGGKHEIYVLGTQFKDSAIDNELMLHELTHAVLAQLIAAEQKKADPNSDAYKLIQELEKLREQATNQIKDMYNRADFEEAVSSVQEFVAWGMTNRDFQDRVLRQIKIEQKQGNRLITGFKQFIDKVVGLLFNKPTEADSNGLAAFLEYTSGLFAAASEGKNDASVSLAQRVGSYTTTELFQALPDTDISPAFSDHLNGLLVSIVQVMNPKATIVGDRIISQPGMNPVAAWEAMNNQGLTGFATKLTNAQVHTPERARFAIDQIEATVQTVLQDPDGQMRAVVRELYKLEKEINQTIKPEDFYAGDWAAATVTEKAEVQKLYDFFTNAESIGNDRTDHLSRFVALGLAHPAINNALNRATKRDTRKLSDLPFDERIKVIFERILDWISGHVTGTYKGQKANDKLALLTERLIEIEAKRKQQLLKQSLVGNSVSVVEEMAAKGIQKAKDTILAATRSKAVTSIQNPLIKAPVVATRIIVGDNVERVLDMVAKRGIEHDKGVKGFAMSMINTVRGPAQQAQEWLRKMKFIEGERKDLIRDVAGSILENFSDKGVNLDERAKKGVSNVFLRSGAHILLDHFTLKDIESLLSDRTQLNKAIADFETKLANTKYKDFYINQAKFLGYELATGRSKSPLLMRNAHNIAYLHGTSEKVTAAEANAVMPDIDVLATLYTLQYSKVENRSAALRILQEENNRQDGGNGIEYILSVHKALEKDSREKLFVESESLMVKGYIPDVYNPNLAIAVADDVEGQQLIDLGYEKGAAVEKDPGDTNRSIRHIYRMRDGGLERYVSGATSRTNTGTQGTLLHNGFLLASNPTGQANIQKQQQFEAKRQQEIAALFNAQPNLDPALIPHNYMVPVVNPTGKIVNWRYTMQEGTKDTVLERDNRFEVLLGSLAGNIYDKQASVEQNTEVLKALFDIYKKDFSSKPDEFVEVSPTSNDKEMREIWAQMPDNARHTVQKLWGKGKMQVPKELVRIVFGYRKESFATLWEQDPDMLNLWDKAFMGAVESMMTVYARTYLKMNAQQAERFTRRAAMVVRRSEHIINGIVSVAKDNIVIRTWAVVWNNFRDNILLLGLRGALNKESLKHAIDGYRGASQYITDSSEIRRLEMKLKAGYTQGRDAEIKQEIARLKDQISRNPVREVIEAGLLPTIVEDVAADDDIYSYKARFDRKVDQLTAKANPTLVKIGKFVLMTHDTPLYKTMRHITQMSDFVGRYVLYQNRINRKRNPLSKADAMHEASETFVNYDLHMHPKMQYMDDHGLSMFSKYFLNIQRVLMKTARENPLRVLMLYLAKQQFGHIPSTFDSSIIARFGNNPFRSSILELPGTVPNTLVLDNVFGLVN